MTHKVAQPPPSPRDGSTHERWADVEQRLTDIIDATDEAIRHRDTGLQTQLLLVLKILRDDVAKWRREANEDRELF